MDAPMNWLRAAAVLGLATLGVLLISGCGKAPAPNEWITPDMQSYYDKGAARIEELTEQAQDANRSAADRAQAYRTLRLEYPMSAFAIARATLAGAPPELAKEIASFLGSQIVMTDHANHDVNAQMTQAMKLHEEARGILRELLLHDDRQVRFEAARTLVSLSDEQAIERISAATSDGKYSSTEAANLFGLASPAVAGSYLEKFLDAADPQTQATAISYLGAHPQYRQRIRDGYFLAERAATITRVAASEVLGKTDPEFDTYVTRVIGQRTTPEPLFEAASKIYLARAVEGDELQKRATAVQNAFRAQVATDAQAASSTVRQALDDAFKRVDELKSRRTQERTQGQR